MRIVRFDSKGNEILEDEEFDIESHRESIDSIHRLAINSMIRKIQNYNRDDVRRENCRYCTYINEAMAGRAFTKSHCKICGETIVNSSTDTDQFCEKCAEKYGICKHCGGSMD